MEPVFESHGTYEMVIEIFICIVMVTFTLCSQTNVWSHKTSNQVRYNFIMISSIVLLDFSLTVKAAPHECVIRTSKP